MVESKDGHSRFIRYKATVVRFSVDAFLLRGASNQVSKMHLEETFYFSTAVCMQAYCYYLTLSYLNFYQLFMHCNLSVGSTVVSPVAKSCNYNTRTKRSGYREKAFDCVFPTEESHVLIFVPSRWVELYGSDLVCACCESTCSLVPSPSESFPQLLVMSNVKLK